MKVLIIVCCLISLFSIASSKASAVPIIALKEINDPLNPSNKLLRFDSTAPQFIQSETPVTGLLPSETLLAIDFRPSNGKLYGVTNLSRLYVINPNTGAATLVSPDTFNPLIPSGTTDVAFDFNPVVDLIRVVTPFGLNLRVNPDSGAVVAVDNPITFATGDANAGHLPNVSAAAYTNNFGGATSTTLYVITNLDNSGASSILATQGSPGGTPVSPNTGQLFTVANISVVLTDARGLDIFPDGTAYALINSSDTFNQFFTVNLSTGALSNFATFGQLFRMRDLAVVLPNSEPPTGTFQFSNSSFSVDEGSHFVTVTIMRTGNTSGPATIDLTTLDNSATQTSDYTIALRRIDFGAGETSKDVKILIVDDAFVDPSESFNVVLTNATGGFLPGRAPSASVTILDNDPITVLPLPNPLGDPQFFVRQHYADFLNREPDPVGFDFWVDQITSCGSNQQCVEVKRIHVSAAFFRSIEFQRTGFTVYLTHRVAQLGLLAPDNLPRYLDYMRDVQTLQKDFIFGAPGADAQLEANTQAFFNDVVKREEFVARFPFFLPNVSYVDILIFNTGVTFSQAERDALVNGLNNQTETRATVLRKVTDNQAFRQAEFNRAFVLMEYFGYLRRTPDTIGFNFWFAKLNSFNGDFIKAEMVKAFISSGEYRSRFGLP
jgi:hypothetical protein